MTEINEEEKKMKRFWMLLLRGLMLRCPVCGQGTIFSAPFQTREQCPVCHVKFEREEGYFSSAMAINIVLSELLAAAIALPLAYTYFASSVIQLLPILIGGTLTVILFPFLLFHHSRGLWMAMDHYLHPMPASEFVLPPPSGHEQIRDETSPTH